LKNIWIEKTEQTVLFKNQENDINFEEYVGTDESGKGDFFGPLVIAGVYVNKELSIKFQDLGIKDSKKLDDKTIIKLAAHIKNSAPHSIVTIMPEKYNSLYTSIKNLNKLLAWGHSRAIENVLMKQNCEYALSDKFGDESLIKNALLEKGKKIRLEQRVRGESYIGVAAASVVARAEFVLKSEDLAQRYKMIFPKGANDKVIETARLFIEKYGRENLKYVAKLHFKTTNYL
jgi:ribonuclease HIII